MKVIKRGKVLCLSKGDPCRPFGIREKACVILKIFRDDHCIFLKILDTNQAKPIFRWMIGLYDNPSQFLLM